MIPKIIHFCWLSGDPYPEDIKKCLDSWKRILPGYEVWLWDTNRFDVNSTLWTKQAFEVKKYAFAADYIRLYALYNYGGIYLDSDILMYKSFDDLLCLPYFMGCDYKGSFEPAVIGAEKGLSWIHDIMERYNNRPFIRKDGSYDTYTLPKIFFDRLINKYKFKALNEKVLYKWNNETIWLFDRDFFNSRSSIGVRQTKRSYCAHNYAGSWTTPKSGFKYSLKSRLPLWLIKLVYDFSHNTYKKNSIHRYDPIYQQKKRLRKS